MDKWRKRMSGGGGFALLWGKILDSSIWVKESKETRLVWITMLAMKDRYGEIQASVIGLADRAKVTPEECRTALKIFLAPDPDDTSKVEEGRRIREIPGGWEIINHDLYRFSNEEQREFWRRQKAEQRAKKKGGGSVGGNGEAGKSDVEVAAEYERRQERLRAKLPPL